MLKCSPVGFCRYTCMDAYKINEPTSECHALVAVQHKKGSRAWLVINTIIFIFIVYFDILGHILMSKLQYVPGLSPGMPWPAAIYDVMTGCSTTCCVIIRVLSAFEDCPSSSSTLTLLAKLPQH